MFDEELAKRIITEKGLAQSTFERWKRGGKIPEKHFKSAKHDVFMIDDKPFEVCRKLTGMNQTELSDYLSSELNHTILSQTVWSWENGFKPNSIYREKVVSLMQRLMSNKNEKATV